MHCGIDDNSIFKSKSIERVPVAHRKILVDEFLSPPTEQNEQICTYTYILCIYFMHERIFIAT